MDDGIRFQTTKLLENNKGENLSKLEAGKECLDLTPKAQS